MEDSCYEESDMDSSESKEYDSDRSSDDESDKESKDVEVESILETSVDPLSVENTCLVFGSEDNVAQSSLQIPNDKETTIDDENATPYQGQMFETWEAAKAFYHEYATKQGFGVRLEIHEYATSIQTKNEIGMNIGFPGVGSPHYCCYAAPLLLLCCHTVAATVPRQTASTGLHCCCCSALLLLFCTAAVVSSVFVLNVGVSVSVC